MSASANAPRPHPTPARRVLLLRANPRPNGYTERLTDLVLQGLRDVNAPVTDVRLADRSLLTCSGCYHCWLVTPGQCIHGDDMGALLEEFLRADVVFCATPLYYFSMGSLLKNFFERTMPLAAPGINTSARGYSRNSTRHPDHWQGKSLITLVTGALREPELYQPVNDTFRLIADSIDLHLGGQLVRPESYLLDYPLSKPITIKRIRAAFVQAGREAGTTGRLTPETTRAAALPLASDRERFRVYSNYYWHQARELGESATNPGTVAARVARDVRILLREMTRAFDPRAARSLRVTLGFEFSSPPITAAITIADGACTIQDDLPKRVDLLIRCPANLWAGLFTRETDPRQALRTGALTLHGDKSLFTRLDRLFPPPPA